MYIKRKRQEKYRKPGENSNNKKTSVRPDGALEMARIYSLHNTSQKPYLSQCVR
jgi:hypothetical protein